MTTTILRSAVIFLFSFFMLGCSEEPERPLASPACASLTPEELSGEVETDVPCGRITKGYIKSEGREW